MLDSASSYIHVECEQSARSTECFEYEQYMDDEITIIPQAYWDDLFDSALSSLDAIPLDIWFCPLPAPALDCQ
jgi:hypothetical protein